MQTANALVYEYNDHYFVIQRSTQGKVYDERMRGDDNVALYEKLPTDCSFGSLGTAVLGALKKYDTVRPIADPWELSKLNEQFCSWVGARGRKPFDRDSRCVQVIADREELEIIPFDNCNKNPWYGPMTPEMGFKSKTATINADSSFETVGEQIKRAFEAATYHADRKAATAQKGGP